MRLNIRMGIAFLVICRRLGDDVVIRVYDEGAGLDSADIAQLLHTDKRRRGNLDVAGEGVGLQVCRDLLQRYGGSLEGASSPTGATMFGLRLPLPDLQAITTPIRFVGDPEIWKKFATVLSRNGLPTSPTISIFSENTDPPHSDGPRIVACYDRSASNSQRWIGIADAVLFFPVTLQSVAQAVTLVSRQESDFA